MPSLLGFIAALMLFSVGFWTAATKHWLWTVPICVLPPAIIKIFFLDDMLNRMAANEAVPIQDLVWFLAAGSVGVVVGIILKSFNK